MKSILSFSWNSKWNKKNILNYKRKTSCTITRKSFRYLHSSEIIWLRSMKRSSKTIKMCYIHVKNSHVTFFIWCNFTFYLMTAPVYVRAFINGMKSWTKLKKKNNNRLLIHRIKHILKHFARTFYWEQTSYFWRVVNVWHSYLWWGILSKNLSFKKIIGANFPRSTVLPKSCKSYLFQN